MNITGKIEETEETEEGKALKYFTDRIFEFDFYCSEDGSFFDPITSEKIHKNAVVCMLRGDYIRSGGSLRGRRLIKVINVFLGEVNATVKHIFTDPQYKDHIKKLKDQG